MTFYLMKLFTFIVKLTTFACKNSMFLNHFVDFLLSFYQNDLKFWLKTCLYDGHLCSKFEFNLVEHSDNNYLKVGKDFHRI